MKKSNCVLELQKNLNIIQQLHGNSLVEFESEEQLITSTLKDMNIQEISEKMINFSHQESFLLVASAKQIGTFFFVLP